MTCDVWSCDIFTILLSCIISPEKKKKKKNINNDLAILPSYDKKYLWCGSWDEEMSILM